MADPAQPSPLPLQHIGVKEFRANMSDFLLQARQGKSFLVTSDNEVLAEIRPPPKAVPRNRQPGALRGQIHMSPDFDEIPPDLLAAMEAGER